MYRFKHFIKEYGILFLLITIITLVAFKAFIFDDLPYRLANNNDHLFQTFQLYKEHIRLIEDAIKTKSLPFYSWHTFLGSNFYASKLYYCSGNIFLPLLYLFKNSILGYMLLETILCIYISAFAIYLYLKKMQIKNNNIAYIIALIYAFGGAASIQMCYPMFHRFYAFLPFLFLGIEKYLNEDKLVLFTITTAILLLQNYYYMFPITLILPFYFIYSAYIKDDKQGFNLIKYLKKAIKLIMAYLIGLMLSAFLLLPGAIFIMGNQRLSYNELSYLLTWPLQTWLGLFYDLFIPIAQLIKINNPFMLVMHTDNTGIAYYYSLYISSFAMLGIINLILKPKNKEHKALLILSILIFGLIMFLPSNSILMAFTTPSLRVMFILSFFMLLMGAKGLDEAIEDGLSLKPISILFIIFILLTIINISFKIISFEHKTFIIFVSIILSLGLIYSLLFNRYRFLCLLLVILELMQVSYMTISSNAYMPYDDEMNMAEYFKYYEENDEDLLYRTYINYEIFAPSKASVLNQNVALTYGFRSLYTYDNTFENPLYEFVNWTKSNLTEHLFNIKDPHLFKLLGIKYVGIIDDEELDGINEYTYAYDINHIHIYKLNDYNHLGHTFSNFVLKSEVIDFDNFNWNEKLIIDENLYQLVKDFKASAKNQLIIQEQYNNNHFKGQIKCDSDELLFIAIPYDEGWKISVDGEIAEIYNVNGGFIGLILNEGIHNIEAYYVPKGFKAGVIISSIGFGLFILLIINDIRKGKRVK